MQARKQDHSLSDMNPALRHGRARLRPDQTLLVYDGDCGFCSRAAAWIERCDRRARLAILPAQTAGLLAAARLTPLEAAQAAWAITPDGRRWRGAGAILVVLEVALGGWLRLSWIYGLPGLTQVADAAYQWVANNRHRLAGTATCALGPLEPLADEARAVLDARFGPSDA